MTITAEQLKNRKIGGSDIATIMGVNPFEQPEHLRLVLTGALPKEDPEEPKQKKLQKAFGNIIEPALAELFFRMTERRLVTVDETLTHPLYDWLTCHIDRRELDRDYGVEFKNVGRQAIRYWGTEGTDHAPDAAILQVQTYMLMTSWDGWDIVPYFGGVDLQIFPVEADPELQRMILDATERFWKHHVLGNNPCPLDFNHGTTADLLKKVHKLVTAKQVTLGEDILHWVNEWDKAKAQKKMWEKTVDSTELHILDAMKDAGIGWLPDGTRIERSSHGRAAYSVKANTYTMTKHITEKK